ncbi:hypothetical protein ABEW34_01905 [Paenibacillus algorifonticola]|uniref:hypothetical protein n=1 Tax=Paenibacillus algorifonticola TaxID=684063 RepID=UPI003D2915FD
MLARFEFYNADGFRDRTHDVNRDMGAEKITALFNADIIKYPKIQGSSSVSCYVTLKSKEVDIMSDAVLVVGVQEVKVK